MTTGTDLVCVSHLRWDFVYQRPQHLMTRAARDRRVFYVEEPVDDEAGPRLEARRDPSSVVILVPHLPPGQTEQASHAQMAALLRSYLASHDVRDFVLWVYSPMPLPALRNLEPSAVVYDCMDELANFRGAPLALRQRERELFAWADLVFTGGYGLWEAKRRQHGHVHSFPSSVDIPHFAQARAGLPEPADLAGIARPRVGFYGVVDERMDINLLGEVARLRPDVQLVILGPVLKIDPDDLPRHPNIHYLGKKSYQELPAYLAHWDAAMLPFAINESTEFISPTKTPEYLAAGKPVVSTAIRDVVRPYGDKDLVLIARDPQGFAEAIDQALSEDPIERRARADALVGLMSWDKTWRRMDRLIEDAVLASRPARPRAASLGLPQPAIRGARTLD